MKILSNRNDSIFILKLVKVTVLLGGLLGGVFHSCVFKALSKRQFLWQKNRKYIRCACLIYWPRFEFAVQVIAVKYSFYLHYQHWNEHMNLEKHMYTNIIILFFLGVQNMFQKIPKYSPCPVVIVKGGLHFFVIKL